MKSTNKDPWLTIGQIAKRTGAAVSAIRFYADKGLIPSVRANSGHRMFARSVIRRVSFILISQKLGYSLSRIAQVLDELPDSRTPNKKDWQRLSRSFSRDIDARIAELKLLKNKLDGCFGCGCLSLQHCHLYNPEDEAQELGAGPHYLSLDS